MDKQERCRSGVAKRLYSALLSDFTGHLNPPIMSTPQQNHHWPASITQEDSPPPNIIFYFFCVLLLNDIWWTYCHFKCCVADYYYNYLFLFVCFFFFYQKSSLLISGLISAQNMNNVYQQIHLVVWNMVCLFMPKITLETWPFAGIKSHLWASV